jgi:hypothetical protein
VRFRGSDWVAISPTLMALLAPLSRHGSAEPCFLFFEFLSTGKTLGPPAACAEPATRRGGAVGLRRGTMRRKQGGTLWLRTQFIQRRFTSRRGRR